ncbi:hypothetical protein HDV62DRAFT_108903 [Trichoderma sp. SZMC 28011]
MSEQVKRACGMRDGWVEWLVHAPSMDPDTRPGSGHQASGLEPQVPLKRPGTGLDHQEEDAVLWKPEAGSPYPHYPHTWGTSWEVAGAVCSTASLRKTREMQVQSSHVVSARAISFLCIANYSIHRKLASFPLDQSIGLRGLGRSPNATSGQCQAEIT